MHPAYSNPKYAGHRTDRPVNALTGATLKHTPTEVMVTFAGKLSVPELVSDYKVALPDPQPPIYEHQIKHIFIVIYSKGLACCKGVNITSSIILPICAIREERRRASISWIIFSS